MTGSQAIGIDFGAARARPPTIIEKSLWLHQLLPPFPQYFGCPQYFLQVYSSALRNTLVYDSLDRCLWGTISINQSIKIYLAPLQDPYLEALLSQTKQKRTVLRRWWNWEQAPFGRCFRSNGCPFQMVGPITAAYLSWSSLCWRRQSRTVG